MLDVIASSHRCQSPASTTCNCQIPFPYQESEMEVQIKILLVSQSELRLLLKHISGYRSLFQTKLLVKLTRLASQETRDIAN